MKKFVLTIVAMCGLALFAEPAQAQSSPSVIARMIADAAEGAGRVRARVSVRGRGAGIARFARRAARVVFRAPFLGIGHGVNALFLSGGNYQSFNQLVTVRQFYSPPVLIQQQSYSVDSCGSAGLTYAAGGGDCGGGGAALFSAGFRFRHRGF